MPIRQPLFLHEKQFEYQNRMASKTLDEAAINCQLHRLEQVRVELNEERSRFIVGVRKLLGSDRLQRRQPIYVESG
jgi:hypothetical protein